MPPRRSSRHRVPARNPEERMMPLVSRGSSTRRSEESSLNENAASASNTAPPGIREEGILATPSQSAGSVHVAAPLSVTDDHPIEGADWKESNISMSEFGDEVLQQMLQKAADAGEVFDSKAIQAMRILGVNVTALTNRASSGGSTENNSVESGATNQETPVANPATQSQTSGVHITPATDRPSSGGNVETHSGRIEGRVHGNPLANSVTRSQASGVHIMLATDRPSSGGNVEDDSGQSERRIRERHHIDLGTRTDTSRASVSSRVPDADAETCSRESVRNVEDEIAVLRIGLQTSTGEIDEVVTLMKVGSRPSVAEVMDHLKQDEEPRTYDLRQRLEPMLLKSLEIRTAKKPMHMRQVAEFRNKWGNNSEILGMLDEVHKMRRLVPCLPCQETDETRKAAGLDVSSSNPIFVVYIFEVEVTATAARSSQGRDFDRDQPAADLDRVDLDDDSMARNRGTRPSLGQDALNYLNARIDEEDIRVYKRHVLEQRGGQGAYTILVFARLVERACERLKIPYGTGSSINKRQKMGNGPHISIADVVLFYSAKFPSDLAPAPSTFGNHRSIYLRAKACMINLENRELTQEDQSFLQAVRAIVHTPLAELALVQPEGYGSLSAFRTRVDILEKMFHKKVKAKEK